MPEFIDIEVVTQKAVRAALAVIDEATDCTANRHGGVAGDRLAEKLHRIVAQAIAAHMQSPLAPLRLDGCREVKMDTKEIESVEEVEVTGCQTCGDRCGKFCLSPDTMRAGGY